MGKLKDFVIDSITTHRDNLNISKLSQGLLDKYIGPYLLERIYLDKVTIYYLGAYDRVIIPLSWFNLFESLDVYGLGGTYEPSDDIEKFIYLFMKFSRGTRIGFSYNTDSAARELLEELYRIGTNKFTEWLSIQCNIDLDSWSYEKIDKIIEI